MRTDRPLQGRHKRRHGCGRQHCLSELSEDFGCHNAQCASRLADHLRFPQNAKNVPYNGIKDTEWQAGII